MEKTEEELLNNDSTNVRDGGRGVGVGREREKGWGGGEREGETEEERYEQTKRLHVDRSLSSQPAHTYTCN